MKLLFVPDQLDVMVVEVEESMQIAELRHLIGEIAIRVRHRPDRLPLSSDFSELLERFDEMPPLLLEPERATSAEHHWRRMVEPHRPRAFTYTGFSPPPLANRQQPESTPRTICYPAPAWSGALRRFAGR